MRNRRRVAACLATLAAGVLAGWPAAPASGAVFLNNADPKQALDQAADEYAAAYK